MVIKPDAGICKLLVFMCCIVCGITSASADEAYIYEAESFQVGRLTNGPTTQTKIDARMSGGEYVYFKGDVVGAWLQFHLTDVMPGRYALHIRYYSDENTGKCKIELASANGRERRLINAAYDMNEVPEGEANPFLGRRSHRRRMVREASVGYVSIREPGFKTVRFTLLRRKGGQLDLGVDKITLVPAFTNELRAPSDLTMISLGPGYCELTWKGNDLSATGYLIERVGEPADLWQYIGMVPSTDTRFVSVGLYDKSEYRHRVRAFNENSLSDASKVIAIVSAAIPTEPTGRIMESKGGRAGESTVIKLKDGRLWMLLNYQDATNDFTSFTIGDKESRDNGKTWSEIRPWLSDSTGSKGYMMPCLVRMDNGKLGLSFTERNQKDLSAHRLFRTSTDEGRIWSDPVLITHDLPLTHWGKTFTGATGPHDRLIQAFNGDLVVPFHLTTGLADEDVDPFSDRSPDLLCLATVVYKSSDGGQTWQRIFGPEFLKGTNQALPYRYAWLDQVLSEPSLVEYQPGSYLLMMRNQSGFIYQTRSLDYGKTWSPVHQSPVRATLAPPKLWNVDDQTIAVIFNPCVDFHAGNIGPRYLLCSMISQDGGETWKNFKLLDGANPVDHKWQFCYPSFLRDENNIHAFYFGPRGFDLMYRQLNSGWFVE